MANPGDGRSGIGRKGLLLSSQQSRHWRISEGVSWSRSWFCRAGYATNSFADCMQLCLSQDASMRVVSDTTRWYRPAHLLLGLLVVEVIVLHSVSVQYRTLYSRSDAEQGFIHSLHIYLPLWDCRVVQFLRRISQSWRLTGRSQSECSLLTLANFMMMVVLLLLCYMADLKANGDTTSKVCRWDGFISVGSQSLRLTTRSMD